MVVREVRTRLALVLFLLGLAVVVSSLLIGTERVSLAQALEEWRSGQPLYRCPMLSILFQQRLPRTLAAFLAGGALAVVGCAFQALLRNPLATPYTLGVASAGAFGAWTVTILVQGALARPTESLSSLGLLFRDHVATEEVLGVSVVQVGAFLFAALDVLIIYWLAARRRMSPSVLLLTGVTLGMLANAGILFMRYLAHPEWLVVMDRWLMGSVDVVGYDAVKTLFVGTAPCVVILLAQSGKLDQLGFSPELAASRGVSLRQLQTVTFFGGSLLTAFVASTVGPIGFVGLIVPHSVRAITGSRHRILMPFSLFAGGAFLCFCDILARKLLTGETPIGIVTALFGGPFFLYLLTRGRFTDWEP